MSGSIIIDLDGTLCNSAHRDHLATAKQWDDFHRAASADKPHKDVQIFAMIASAAGLSIYAVTGRNERYRSQTVEWLHEYAVPIDALLMRPDNDFTPDHELKPALLAAHFGSMERALQDVLCILEDRDKVVEAWRNLGFRCWQVQPGGY